MRLSGLGNRFIGILFGFLIAVPDSIVADDRSGEQMLKLRADFRAAERALARGQYKRYLGLKTSLGEYPLLPYLEYQELKKELHVANPERVETFLQDYADTPLAARLRAAWLDQLAKRKRWADFLKYYQSPGSTRARCNRLRAFIETGSEDQAFAGVPTLWLTGRSQPRECDPVFESWIKQGHLTTSLVWQRIALAMASNQTRLAKYLGRYLPAGEKPVIEKWLRVHHNPDYVAKIAGQTKHHVRNAEILLHGIERLARKDEERALSTWDKIRKLYNFSVNQEATAERAIALAFVRRKSPEETTDLAFRYSACPDDSALNDTRIRRALEQTDWDLALDWIESLPQSEQDTERYIYWRARALGELGDREESRRLLRELVGTRSYYGFLAADALGSGFSFNHDPVLLEENLERDVSQHPSIVRAKELLQLGRLIDARREWRMILEMFSHDQVLAAAKLARGWGWHEQAIFSLAHLEYWDDLELRFPLEHKRPLEQQADGNGLDPAWIFAVVRQESAFMKDARSPAGALGLMQLMPRTAKSIAKKLKVRQPRKSDLLKPATNIRLGTAYLGRIYRQLDENPVLATAAYNAGPHRVKKWLPKKTVPADVWIETVPFQETRDYLRRVLAYTVIYEQRLGLPSRPLEHRMPPIHPPTPRTTEVSKATEPSG